jgi:asparagine synthase (glutamine-hydrolysing)
MCSIAGIARSDGANIALMNRCLAHRGPDDRGIYTDEQVSLGHNRLAIQDLSPRGHQPMQNVAGTLQVTFNGEIYNFKELRAQLQSAGIPFRTESDTEVLLLGYEHEGIDFFKKLRGMWAFAIYDKLAQKLVLSRDPFGIKPLYYYFNNGHFAFASELRGLKPILKTQGYSDDVLAHRLYFLFGYIPAPHSPFMEVRKLLPGEVGIFNLVQRSWASVETLLPYRDTDLSLTDALDDSIRAHFVSDVPVGLFYSGGIDSTLLLARSRSLDYDPQAFFLHVPNRLDNEYALAAAKELGVTITTFEFEEAQARDAFLRARATLDEPFADTSYIPTEYLSSQVAKTHKVILSGEGGDEFFGGYHRHAHLMGLGEGKRFISGAVVSLLPERVRRAVESKLNRDARAAYLEFIRIDHGSANRSEALAFLRTLERPIYDELSVALDQALYLSDDLLFKIDRAGMQHGLEGRVPFLDPIFFGAARKRSAQERHGASPSGKKLIKDMLRAYLPEQLVERPKQGFSMPLVLLNSLSSDIEHAALEEATRHPELLPFDPTRALRHPQTRYALLMWAGWRTSFFS